MTSDLRDQLQATLGSAYTLERELGGGGMSRVFLAEDTRLGRRVEEAREIMASLRERSRTGHIGESVWFGPALLDGDEDAIAAAVHLNIDAGTGPTTLSISVDRELAVLLTHPRLGPLVRQLSLYTEATPAHVSTRGTSHTAQSATPGR
jgi:hypothetical protein